MTKTRNKTFVKQVMIRDLGLCRCCGFKASCVHHIIPLIYGGEDIPKNMVALCRMCHTHSPDDFEKFKEYLKRGGHKTDWMFGIISRLALKEELKNCGKLSFQYLFEFGRKMINVLKEIDRTNCIEEYQNKDSTCVKNVDL